jgi:hypothetical protein
MQGYGLPRNKDVEQPDLADMRRYGLKAGYLNPAWRHGCNCKDSARRFWKKEARRIAKEELRKELLEDGQGGNGYGC